MAQTPGKTENRGGRRQGSGRKRVSISDMEVKKLLREFRKKEKETGISIWGKLADIAYRINKATTVKEQTTAIKLYAECVITRASESESTVTKEHGPAIYLPEMRPDPADIRLVKAGNG